MEKITQENIELTGYVLSVSSGGYLLLADNKKDWHSINFPMEKYKDILKNAGSNATFDVTQKKDVKTNQVISNNLI